MDAGVILGASGLLLEGFGLLAVLSVFGVIGARLLFPASK